MSKLIRFIWQELHGLWQERNIDVHGEGRQSEKERETLERTVETLYNTSTALCQHDRVIFEIRVKETRNNLLVLEAANYVIWHNEKRIEKNLWTDNETGDSVTLTLVATPDDVLATATPGPPSRLKTLLYPICHKV